MKPGAPAQAPPTTGDVEALLRHLLGDRAGVLVAGAEPDAFGAERLRLGDLRRVVGVLGAVGQRVEHLDAVRLEQRGQHARAFALGDRVLGVIDDDDLLDLVVLEPRIDHRLELLVAGQRVAERPDAHVREAGLGRAEGVDDGLVAVELRRDGLELAAEARPRDRQHLVALDQTAERLERLGFERLRVVADQLDRHAADAALGVDLLDRDLHGDFRALAPLGALAGQRDQAADLDAASIELGRFGLVRRRSKTRRPRRPAHSRTFQKVSLSLPSLRTERQSHALWSPVLQHVSWNAKPLHLPLMRHAVRDRCAGPRACSAAPAPTRSKRCGRAP